MESLPAMCASQQTLFTEQVPAAIAMFDREMRYLAVSRRYLSDLALLFSTAIFAPAEVIGRSFHEISPDMPQRWHAIHARALAGEELAQEEELVLRPDGGAVWVRWSMKPWRTVDGRIGGALLFSELITEQVEIRHALADSEARFRATFENAAVGITHVAPDGSFLRFNKALSRLLGWPADELITKSVQEITHPDDRAAELAQFKQLEDGRVDSYSMEKRDLRKDGTIVWIRLTRSCVRKSDGSVDYFVAVVEDISARKRAEEQLHLLMREANHRVKNLLSLVQAIARQTAAGNVEGFIGRFTERIQALAANQDLLGRDERQGADLEDLVRAHLAYFADLVGSRITVHGSKLHLNATAAQAIGLALHELATNAGKYGALSTDAGRVDVGWRLDGDALTMSWTERDGPPVRPPERRGFGTTVIDAMARQALGGEVQLDYARSGLEWHLTCPRGNALEP
jgi:PAS domain S-box-containing protein